MRQLYQDDFSVKKYHICQFLIKKVYVDSCHQEEERQLLRSLFHESHAILLEKEDLTKGDIQGTEDKSSPSHYSSTVEGQMEVRRLSLHEFAAASHLCLQDGETVLRSLLRMNSDRAKNVYRYIKQIYSQKQG